MHREGRAADDGYRSPLVPGLRASTDARRLAGEIAFASARLDGLESDPPGLYGEIRALAPEDLERATWAAFLTAYLVPLEDAEPFAGIRRALELMPAPPPAGAAERSLPDAALAEVPLGPHSSHERARGATTLVAYAQWAARAAAASGAPAAAGGADPPYGPQAVAFRGDLAWGASRRFDRLFERLALPGLSRAARYEVLVTLGRLGLYELQPDALHLGAARGPGGEDATTASAKRVFGIGDPLLLERRAAALAEAASAPVEALDLALANWGASERATRGFAGSSADADALELAEGALGL